MVILVLLDNDGQTSFQMPLPAQTIFDLRHITH
jgi:hypothetical protein